MNSIQKNFFINVIKIFFNLLFPIITFPYISRILGPIGIGKITFATSIINYFLLFTNLGIPLYGIREIARTRENRLSLSKSFSEILFLNLITTIIGIIIFIIFFQLELFGNDINLFQVMGLNIVFTFIGVEWYFQGIEDYGYITKRSILFKIISITLMFIFVKKKEDIVIYAGILVLALVGSNILNFFKAKKEVLISLKNVNIKKHLKPILTIFSMNIAISIYTNLDSVMLGYCSSEYSLGIYSASSKIIHLVLGIVTSLGAVLLPRISNYIVNKKEKELKEILENTLTFLLAISLPCIIGINFTAVEVIKIFSGNEFIMAIKTMRILSAIIFFIAFSNFLGIQILYPRGEEKKVLYSVIVGAVINFSLNWILIPKYAENGAAVATVIAEGFVLLTQIFLGYKYLKFKIFTFENLKVILVSIFMGIGLLLMTNYYTEKSIIISLLLKIILGILIYIISLVILKERFIIGYMNKVINKVKER